MSFQDEYKITSADRLDKGVYGLPDTPGMTTAAIQERFDSLGNLAIDKFNALVEAASDVVDGSDTKFPTNKAVEDYISGEGGAIIDDTTPSLHKAYSSQNVENMFGDVASRVIDDTEPLSNKTYSSEEIEEKLSNIPSPESIIDDDTASTDTTYSSSKLESDFISVSDTEEQTATDEFTTINGGLLSECKVALSPNQDLHGYDSPWVGGAGKNKLPLVLADIKANNTAGTWSGNVYSYNGSTITVNTDESGNVTSIDVANTPSSAIGFTLFYASGTIPFDTNLTYILNGCPSGGAGSSNYKLDIIYEKDGINNILAVDTGSGASANFNALVGAISMTCRIIIYTNASLPKTFYPMIRLATESDPTFEPYSNICPISGHTQVEVENHQKNLFNPSNVIIGYIGQSGGGYKVISLANTRAIYAPCEPNTAYTISKTIGARFGVGWTDTFPDINVTVYGMTSNNTASEITLTTGATAKYIVAFVWFGTYDTITADEMLASCQIELGSTATSYEPYNGYQVTVNLGGTYYSGTLDVVSGVLTVDKVKAVTPTRGTLDSSGKLYTINFSGGTIHNHNDGVTATPYVMCSHLDVDSLAGARDTQRKCICQYAGGVYIGGYIGEETALDNMLASADFSIVFELATPQSIQLSPTMVKALVGENHLSAPLDGQEIIESVYSPLAKWNAVIDDTTASNDTTYSSNKINTIVPKIDDNTTSASKVFSSLKTANLITELSERFDFSTTEKPLGWWTDGKVYYGKVINIMGCPKEMFGLMVDLGVEVDTFIGIFAVGNAKDDNYNDGYCMGGTIYCKVTKSEGQNTQIQPACAVMALSRASLLVLYTKVE